MTDVKATTFCTPVVFIEKGTFAFCEWGKTIRGWSGSRGSSIVATRRATKRVSISSLSFSLTLKRSLDDVELSLVLGSSGFVENTDSRNPSIKDFVIPGIAVLDLFF